MDFPIYKTKTTNVKEYFKLNIPAERHKYFQAKAGKQIEELKTYLNKNTFVGFLLAKKQAGKGTYSRMFQEVVGSQRVALLSIGDLIRDTHSALSNAEEQRRIVSYVERHHRGHLTPAKAIDALINRSTNKISIPTELVLTLIKMKIGQTPNKAIFIDGFPRTLDQVSYSLYFREIMNLRDDPDFFVLIDICESIIDARMKARVVCPICKTSRNTKLLPTQYIDYNKNKNIFVLKCDNPECKGCGKQVMEAKEGDDLGIEAIRKRLDDDEDLMKKALLLHGIPKVLIRNYIPVSETDGFDEYEITPQYSYEYDEKAHKVNVKESPWIVKDDNGVNSHSLLAPAALLSMINQIHKILIG